MKFLKSYNKLFESFDKNIIDDVEDILLPFSDDRIMVNVKHISLGTYFGTDNISVTLGFHPDYYSGDEIIRINTYEYKDEFLRLLEYMESKGYELSSINYEHNRDIIVLKVVDIGLGIDAICNQLFNGIGESNYLKIWFKRK